METKFDIVKVGHPIKCYEKNYVIKDFYIKNINVENLQKGYYITLGGGQYYFNIVGHTHSVKYDSKTNMYKLRFYKKVINAIDDIPNEFKNCLLFNIMKWIEPSIICRPCEGVPQPKEEIIIEYYDAKDWIIPKDIFYTYVLSHDLNAENVIQFMPNDVGGLLYDYKKIVLFLVMVKQKHPSN